MKILKCFSEESFYDSPFFNRQKGFHYLIETNRGDCIETGIYLHYWDEIEKSIAIDVSCMIGCPEKCFFCSSKNNKYIRNLTSDEILEEIFLILNLHPYLNFEKVVISFQGIGEPSLMPREIISVAKSIRCIIPDCALNISTTGVNIDAFKLWKESQVTWTHLQISATIDSLNNLKRIDEIVQYLDKERIGDYFIQIKFNYILIENINDKEENLKRLISIFRNKKYVIKLSKLNKFDNKVKLKSSSIERFKYFKNNLTKGGIKNYIFGSYIDSAISCGQLVYLINHQNE